MKGAAQTKKINRNDASEASAGKRRAGRPRNQEAGDTILATTLQLLGERGYAGLTVDDIVARARVSKSTIYRRWPTKEELVVAAFDLLPELKVPNRGSLIKEFLDLVGQYDRMLHQTPLASVLPGLIAEAAHNEELARQLTVTFGRRREPCKRIVLRAIERDELPPDTDVELAIELFMAPLVQRSMFASHRLNRQDFRNICDITVAGIWGVLKSARSKLKRPTAKRAARRA